MAENTLTITDNRTNKTYTVPVENGTIRAMDLRQIKTGVDDFGLMTYDPAFMNGVRSWKLPTCCCSANFPPRKN
jgi:citrate synthase